jgi:NAD(P)-dependent dehydrogenase (short-subunit alcohol dehydrogenase family)
VNVPNPFDLEGRVAVVTGGYGVLGAAIAAALAQAGARVAILGRRVEAAESEASRIRDAGYEATTLIADVLDEATLGAARDTLLERWGRIDILVNAAGGNVPRARSDTRSVFEIPLDAFDEVLRLNLHGTIAPSMVFGEAMARAGRGSIINISSMAAMRALSGVMGYSAAKAAVDNFTRWLAVDVAFKHGDGLRVNAVAPGFFLSEQNRSVMLNPDGSYSERAERVIRHTPMGRLGRPEELMGAIVWLSGDAASFVTGVVIPVDGGFLAFGGV